MDIIKFQAGDILHMKKKHPCGSDKMSVIRVGSDVRIKCTGCDRDVTVARVKLEKNIRSVESPTHDPERKQLS